MSTLIATLEPDVARALPPLQALLDCQRRAFFSDLPVSLAQRQDRLDRGLAMLIGRRERLHAAAMADFQTRSAEWTLLAEIFAPAQVFLAARKQVRHWMRHERRKAPMPFALFGAKAQIQYQPLGVIGIMAAWNAPLNLALVPLATALAAGNRALLCPSDQMPNVASALDEAVRAHFDPSEVAVVRGGLPVSKAFSHLAFDHLIFTGSSIVGAEVMANAARNLVPVTLELGGKCPAIIAANADLEDAAQRLVSAKTYNGGQACLAPDHLFVHATQHEAFLAALDRAAAALHPRGIADPAYCGIATPRHYQRLQTWLDEARQSGATVRTLGLAGAAPTHDQITRRIAPCVVIGASAKATIMREEIFGPVFVMTSYETLDTACQQIAAAPKPLGLYIFSRSAATRRYVLERTFSGGVTENDALFHYSVPDLPFGGVGKSGIGAYSFGIEGFRCFSHARAIYTQAGPRWLMRVMRPPYGRLFDLMIRRQIERMARRFESP